MLGQTSKLASVPTDSLTIGLPERDMTHTVTSTSHDRDFR